MMGLTPLGKIRLRQLEAEAGFRPANPTLLFTSRIAKPFAIGGDSGNLEPCGLRRIVIIVDQLRIALATIGEPYMGGNVVLARDPHSNPATTELHQFRAPVTPAPKCHAAVTVRTRPHGDISTAHRIAPFSRCVSRPRLLILSPLGENLSGNKACGLSPTALAMTRAIFARALPRRTSLTERHGSPCLLSNAAIDPNLIRILALISSG